MLFGINNVGVETCIYCCLDSYSHLCPVSFRVYKRCQSPQLVMFFIPRYQIKKTKYSPRSKTYHQTTNHHSLVTTGHTTNHSIHPSNPPNTPTMPNGFPAFRYDPTTAPRYLVVTAKPASDTASRSTDSARQSTESARLLKDRYPTERDTPKKSHSKPKGKFLKLFG